MRLTPPPHVTNSSMNSSTNAFNVTMREFVDEFSEHDVLTFDQRMRRILMHSTNFVDDSFVAEFVDQFVTCGGGLSTNVLLPIDEYLSTTVAFRLVLRPCCCIDVLVLLKSQAVGRV